MEKKMVTVTANDIAKEVTSASPKATNRTDEGRTKNPRVALVQYSHA